MPDNDSLATAIDSVATQLKWLGTGDAVTQMGAVEAHGVMVKEGLESVAASITELAAAIRESSN